jgi:hypothetical protein
MGIEWLLSFWSDKGRWSWQICNSLAEAVCAVQYVDSCWLAVERTASILVAHKKGVGREVACRFDPGLNSLSPSFMKSRSGKPTEWSCSE